MFEAFGLGASGWAWVLSVTICRRALIDWFFEHALYHDLKDDSGNMSFVHLIARLGRIGMAQILLLFVVWQRQESMHGTMYLEPVLKSRALGFVAIYDLV